MSDEPTANAASIMWAIIAALCAMVFFVWASYLVTGESTGLGAGLMIRTPDDWYNGTRICITALLASAVGTLIYRRPYSRPMAVAIALGLVFLNVDVAGIWEQVRSLVSVPPYPSKEIQAVLPPSFSLEEYYRLTAEALTVRARLYWSYYMAYIAWTIAVLYSGYLGQYLTGLTLFKTEARKESAIYLAENAGKGLASSVAAGLVAIFLAAGFAEIALPASRMQRGVPERDLVRVMERPGRGAAPSRAGGEDVRRSSSGMMVLNEAGGPASEYSPARKLRTRLLLVGLTFFVTGYVAALAVRPRTSTWVAVGAIAGVIALPLLAGRFGVRPQRPTAFFTVLEVSPLMLAGTAIASSLVGDWLARTLLTRSRRAALGVSKPVWSPDYLQTHSVDLSSTGSIARSKESPGRQ